MLIYPVLITILCSSIFGQGNWTIYTKENGLISNNISHIFKDSDNNLWFNSLSAKKGIQKFDGKEWTSYYNRNSLVLVSTFFEDSKGNVWLGSRSAKYILANALWKINGDAFEKVSKIGTKYIAEDSKGILWFGGRKLCSYDGNIVTEYSAKDIGVKRITALYLDKSNILWVGTHRGTSFYDGTKWNLVQNETDCPSKQVNSIISDKDGNVWFGAEDGVFKYDGTVWSHYTTNDGLIAESTLTIRIDSRNTVYAIAGKPEKESIGIGIVDISNAVGTGLAKTGLCFFENDRWRAFTERKGAPSGISSIYYEDKSGNLWFNSKDKTIYKFNGNDWDSLSKYSGYVPNMFRTILEDSKENYWFGIGNVGGKGVAKFDGSSWTYYTKDSGLPGTLISSIMEDADGNIWFGTPKGVAKYTHSNLQ